MVLLNLADTATSGGAKWQSENFLSVLIYQSRFPKDSRGRVAGIENGEWLALSARFLKLFKELFWSDPTFEDQPVANQEVHCSD
jgi:hypothetical protein